MRKGWTLLAVLLLSLSARSSVQGAPAELFRKILELREPSAQARKAALLPDGKVVYY